jgi:hypothetical protein
VERECSWVGMRLAERHSPSCRFRGLIAAAFFRSDRCEVSAIVDGTVFWNILAIVLYLGRRASRVTDIQWFAFVILPVAVGFLGWGAVWAGRRFIP